MLSAVYAVVMCLCVCVCQSVCVFDTLQYCIKTAKLRITQITPHGSPRNLIFWCQRSWQNSNVITPYGGDKCKCGGLELATFDGKRTTSRKRYKIDAYFLLKSNRKSYVLYRMAMFLVSWVTSNPQTTQIFAFCHLSYLCSGLT